MLYLYENINKEYYKYLIENGFWELLVIETLLIINIYLQRVHKSEFDFKYF